MNQANHNGFTFFKWSEHLDNLKFLDLKIFNLHTQAPFPMAL